MSLEDELAELSTIYHGQREQAAPLLDQLEQDTLIAAGTVRSLRMRYTTLSDQLVQDEERLGEMLQTVLKLKVLLGVPTSLTMDKEK